MLGKNTYGQTVYFTHEPLWTGCEPTPRAHMFHNVLSPAGGAAWEGCGACWGRSLAAGSRFLELGLEIYSPVRLPDYYNDYDVTDLSPPAAVATPSPP